MKNVSENLIIRVFPNSGHQYETIPLSQILPDWEDDELKTFVENNQNNWQAWDAFTPWVRYRYENRKGNDEEPVLRLAVETNLGSSSNGILFDIEEMSSNEEIKEQETPYASYDEANIEEDFGRNRCIPLTYLPNIDEREIEVSITIHWIRSTGTDPVDVDLVVDLGNTRTVALLLEHPSHEPISFGRRVQPVRFMPPGSLLRFKSLMGQEFRLMICPLLTHGSCLKGQILQKWNLPSEKKKFCGFMNIAMKKSRNHRGEKFLSLLQIHLLRCLQHL